MTAKAHHLRALVFDIGNTIVDARSMIAKSAKFASTEFKKLVSDVDSDALAETYVNTSDSLSHRHINRIFSDALIVSRTLRAARITANEHHTYSFLALFRQNIRQLLKFDNELHHTLLTLRRRGLRLCAVSDGTTVEQYELLASLRLLTLFDPIIVSESFGSEKTSTTIFHALARTLRLNGQRIAMIGDDLRRDMYWAKRSGFVTIHQQQFRKPTPATLARYGRYVDLTITSIHQLPGVVR